MQHVGRSAQHVGKPVSVCFLPTNTEQTNTNLPTNKRLFSISGTGQLPATPAQRAPFSSLCPAQRKGSQHFSQLNESADYEVIRSPPVIWPIYNTRQEGINPEYGSYGDWIREERDIILLVSEHKLHIFCPGEEAAENTAGDVLGCASDIASHNGLGPPISLPKFSENTKKYDSLASPRSHIFSYFPRI